jgi:hypothetical protein
MVRARFKNTVSKYYYIARPSLPLSDAYACRIVLNLNGAFILEKKSIITTLAHSALTTHCLIRYGVISGT